MDYEVKNIYGKIKNVRAAVSVPGSKSITARALLIAALARGVSTLYNAQFSDDCATFANCLKSLGIGIEADGTTVKVFGCGGKLPIKSATINVGSAGTAARFLTALLAFTDGEFTIDSSEQMKRRPQAPLIKALRSAGTDIEGETFPLKVRGSSSPKNGIEVDITESSQFLSALLISSVCLEKPVPVSVVGEHGLGYVDMTADMMWSFGVNVEKNGNTYIARGSYSAKKYEIEPDLSAASYFFAMNRILGTDIKVRGVMPHSMQSDAAFIKLISDFDGGTVDMSAFSDQALTLAAIAPYFSSPTVIKGVGHIRKQECDRIKAISCNLAAMGVKCDETDDGVKIYPSRPQSAKIETFGDHRVAMSFALTGLRADGIVIKNAEVCSKTFSDYFSVLSSLCKELAGE